MKLIPIGMRLVAFCAFTLVISGCSITAYMGPPEGRLEDLEIGAAPPKDTVRLATQQVPGEPVETIH